MRAAVVRQRASLLAAAALLLAAVALPGAAAWTDCSTGPTVFKVSEVELVPTVVKPGDVANFTITAEAAKEVRMGVVQMIVHYAGMPVWTQLDNLCDKTAAGCPVQPGPVQVLYSQLFPAITPPGFYDVTLNGHSITEALFCVKVEFQVVPPGAEQVAEGWAAALKGPAQQQVLSTHRKSLA